jgi:hypothetical protein
MENQHAVRAWTCLYVATFYFARQSKFTRNRILLFLPLKIKRGLEFRSTKRPDPSLFTSSIRPVPLDGML